MKQFYNTTINKKGFTMVEAIVAIFIITTGIVGVLSLATQTISSATYSTDKLIAAYLAQEGIEIVRNIRDTNWLEGASSWTDGIDMTSDYGLDHLSLTFPDLICSLGPGNYLKFDGNFYNCTSGTDTKFKREITITQLGVDILNVSVQVEWQEKGKFHKVEAQENLYNWK